MYPTLLEFGSIAISSLWFFVALGFLATGILLVRLALHHRLKIAFLTDHFFRILLFGLLGSRLVYIAFNWRDLNGVFHFFTIWDKGLSFWGAVAGIVYAFYRYGKKEKEPVAPWLDILSISLLGGMILGDIGAFLEGVNYGTETGLPWGMSFQNWYIPYTIPIHPVQLYAALYTSILFGVIFYFFWKEKIKEDGEVALWAVFGYSFFRFLEEFTRGEETIFYFIFRLEQWIALTAFITSGIFLILRYNKRRKNISETPSNHENS